VDDQPVNIDYLSKILRNDYNILVATSGKKAIEIANMSHKLHLVLLDISMPEMDGYEVCRILKENPSTMDIPVIFVTALDGVEDEEKGFYYGAADYISKPFQPAIVRARVKNQIELKRAKEALEKTRESAIKANQAKSEFLANMSHEIRTPLNGVVGFTELLLQTELNEIQKEYAENAYISGKALLDIINDILDFSKIEAGKLDLEIIKADILSVIEESADIVKFQAEKKGLELLLDIPFGMPTTTKIDPIRLKQILVNLLNNAVKFTEQGEIELKVTFERINNSVGKYTFAVRDTGIGIPPEKQTKLFQAFSQADSSITRKFGGTGLGLIISNMLAEKMGSKISLTSQVEEGSTFEFSIILEYESNEPAEYNFPIKNVLIIDDNRSTRLLLKRTFYNLGISYIGADDGIKALNFLEKYNFGLIIIDYHMPYLDGMKLLQLMREKIDKSVNIPVIILYKSSDMQSDFNKFNNVYKLTKPIKTKDLFVLMDRIFFNKVDNENKNEEIALYHHNKSINILIAEDVPLNMSLIKSMIQKCIYNPNIIEANDGITAVEKFKENEVDLVFMDIQMPLMDGIDASNEIRNIEKERDSKKVPIIALTAGALKEERDKALEYGMDDFLTKPIELKKLREIIINHIIEKK
jgi:CheY-like chemotaxis protein